MTESTDGNGKITWRDIYHELEKHSEDRKEMERRLMAKIDDVIKCMPSVEAVRRNREDIERMEEKIERVNEKANLFGGIGAIITVIGSIIIGWLDGRH